MDTRRLALRTERLAELTTDDLVRVAAAASGLPCVQTHQLVCDPSDYAASLCCYSGWC